jgi:hypothetical protein
LQLSVPHAHERKAKGKTETHPLDRSPLILRDANLLCSRRQRRIPLRILRQQLQKLLWILADQRRQLRVARPDLLQNRLQHARLRLHNLAQLLELRVRAQEIQVAGPAAGGCLLHALGGVQGACGFGDLAAAGAVAGSGAAVGLGGGFEEVDGGVGVGGGGVGGRGGCGSCGGGGGGGI